MRVFRMRGSKLRAALWFLKPRAWGRRLRLLLDSRPRLSRPLSDYHQPSSASFPTTNSGNYFRKAAMNGHLRSYTSVTRTKFIRIACA